MTLASPVPENAVAAAQEILRRYARAFAALGGFMLMLLVALDALAPGGRGFLVVTRANSDSICYFSTAHSLMFDRDFDLTNQLRVMLPDGSPRPPGAARWMAIQPESGLPGSPYALGYSLLGMPFLALGTGADWLAGNPANGYGFWAERLFAAANVVYLTVALILLHRWLTLLGLHWGREARRVAGWAAVAAVALVPSTALGYYSYTVMSHTVSFFATALFLLTWWRRRDSMEAASWSWVGAAAGLMTLCRWQDALFLVMPAVYDFAWAPPWRLMLRRPWWRSRAAGAAVCLLVLAPQFWQWHTIYGAWFTVPQGSQFVQWPPAHALHVLFSSHNGLFFTTPATLAGFAGLLWGLRRFPRDFAPLVAAGAVQVLFVGCMPTNWSGQAFAMRLLISSATVIGAGYLFLFLYACRRGRWAALAWICAGSAFTLLAAVQWRYEFIPRRGPLTFQEAFTDKLRLPQAYRRHKAMEAASRSPGNTVQALEQVRARHGEGTVLLRQLAEAYDRAGLAGPRDRTLARLSELDARRLF